MAKEKDAVPNDEFSELKETVLNAVLNNKPLPGSTMPVNFPDLQIIFNQPVICLVDESFTKPVHIEKLQRPLTVLREKDLQETAAKNGRLVYLQFTVESENSAVTGVKLDAKVWAEGNEPVVLSSLQLKFQKVNGEWKVIDQPIVSSS